MSDNPYATPGDFEFGQSSGSSGFPPPGKDEATTILVYGILAVVICGLLGIVAWMKGNDYQRRCQLAHVEPEGTAVAGRILGIIATVLTGIGIVFGCLGGMLSVLAQGG